MYGLGNTEIDTRVYCPKNTYNNSAMAISFRWKYHSVPDSLYFNLIQRVESILLLTIAGSNLIRLKLLSDFKLYNRRESFSSNWLLKVLHFIFTLILPDSNSNTFQYLPSCSLVILWRNKKLEMLLSWTDGQICKWMVSRVLYELRNSTQHWHKLFAESTSIRTFF